MNIFEHFACYTNLPIRLDDICEQAVESGVVDDIRIAYVDIDPNILLGMHYLYEEPSSSGKARKIAEIYISANMPDDSYRRLVCCKEILHIFDDDRDTAKSKEAVTKLIDQVVVPSSSGISMSAISDHNGMLYALMLLLPRDALTDDIIPGYLAGDISVEDVAVFAKIPEAYAQLALSPIWLEILDKIE